MAFTNTGTNGRQAQKTYATDEAGMLKDAKAYAKRDFGVVVATLKRLGQNIDQELIAEALIQVKLEQIKEARLNRVSYFD